MKENLSSMEKTDALLESKDSDFCEFIDLVKKNIESVLLERFWNISNLELVNKDYNFTNWVFKFYKWGETFVLKTNYGNRSIWSNYRWFLEDKHKFENMVKQKKCSDIIKKQFEDYKVLNDLWINTINQSKIQLIDNFLLIPYLDWEDLWSFISNGNANSDEKKYQIFLSLQNVVNSFDELYNKWLVFWDLKVDNIFIKNDWIILIDPQIKEWVPEDDIWKLIFSILLLCYKLDDIYWYDEFRNFFINTLWYSPHVFKNYRNHWYDIYKFLVNLNYPKNSKEVIMMQKFYQHLLNVYKWKKDISFTQHKKDL